MTCKHHFKEFGYVLIHPSMLAAESNSRLNTKICLQCGALYVTGKELAILRESPGVIKVAVTKEETPCP